MTTSGITVDFFPIYPAIVQDVAQQIERNETGQADKSAVASSPSISGVSP